MFSYKIDKNLKLILPQLNRAEEMAAVVLENIDRLKPWMPWATDEYSVDSAKEYIQRTLKEFAEDGRFSATILLDDKIVGPVGFHNLDKVNKFAHIGYWLAKDAEGKGIITKSCRVLIDYLFQEMDLNRIEIDCNVENTKSRAVPEGLGFKFEGILRQIEFHQGKFGDWAVYAMLKEDWKKQ